MTTAYDSVYDLFLIEIKDWKIDALYTASPTNFAIYLKGFLVLCIPEFDVFSDQSLARTDSTSLFTETLTDKNMQILAKMMVIKWMKKEIQDVRQMNLHITGKDFRTYSEAQNLKGKESYLIFMKEELSQALSNYAWYGYDFTDWQAGTFETGA